MKVHSSYRQFRSLGALLLALLIAWGTGAHTAQAQQPPLTAEEQCAEGARLFLDNQQSVEAVPLLEAGFAGREQATFDDQHVLGLCGFALGYVRVTQGDYEGGLQAYRVAQEAFHAGDNPLGEAAAFGGIGQANQLMWRYPEALKAYQGQLEIARAIEQRLPEGTALQSMGDVYRAQGDHDKAIDSYKQVLEIWRAENRSYDQAIVLNVMGIAYVALGRYTEALDAHRRALEIFRASADQINEATSLKLIGTVLADQGQYSEALKHYQQALDLYRKQPDPVSESSIQANIGRVYREQARYGDALEAFQQALEQLKAAQQIPVIESFSIPTEAVLLSNISTIYLDLGLTDKAAEYATQALEIARKYSDHASEASRLLGRGMVFEKQGGAAPTPDQQQQLYNQAEADYRAALALIEELGLDPIRSAALNNLGWLSFRRGRLEEALPFFEQALAIAQELEIDTDQAFVHISIGAIYRNQERYPEALAQFEQALAFARTSGVRATEAEALIRMARVFDIQRRTAEAQEHYEQAMALIGQIRAVAGDEQGRAGFSAGYADVYEAAARFYLKQGDPAAAFDTVERGRARAFLDSLVSGTIQFAAPESNALAERVRETDAILEAARREVALAQTGAISDTAVLAQLNQQLAQAQQDYANAQAQIEAQDRRLAALLPGSGGSVIPVADLQKLLPPDTTLLAYQLGEETTLAFVVTSAGVTAEELPIGRAALDQQVRALQSFDGGAEQSTARLKALYAHLIAPIEMPLTTAQLIIVPHGVLHYLPFGALSPDGQNFLAGKYALTLLPAAGLLPYVQRPLTIGSTLGPALVLANPDGPPTIPGVASAAQQIATLLNVQPLLRADATKAALRDGSAQAAIVHLGAHGSFNPQSPLQSYVQLTPAGSDDGQLKTEDVYTLNMEQLALVTLSACETQVNQLTMSSAPLAVTAGDDLVGLQRAFFFAGARNVVTTLWKVPDAPSQMMMERFYMHLRDGASPAEALRQAQQAVRETYPDPHDWAGFVLSGTGTTPLVVLPWWRQVPWWAWLTLAIVGIGLAALAGYVIVRRKAHAPPSLSA